MLFRQLAYQASGSRTLSSTFASGKASQICSQNVQAGQSTVDSQPSNSSRQSTGSPSTAACHPGSSSGCRATSIMWNDGPKPSCSSAPLSDIVPVRPKPAPITFIASSSTSSTTSIRRSRPGRPRSRGRARPAAGSRISSAALEHEEARGRSHVPVLGQHRRARRDLLVRQPEAALQRPPGSRGRRDAAASGRHPGCRARSPGGSPRRARAAGSRRSAGSSRPSCMYESPSPTMKRTWSSEPGSWWTALATISGPAGSGRAEIEQRRAAAVAEQGGADDLGALVARARRAS